MAEVSVLNRLHHGTPAPGRFGPEAYIGNSKEDRIWPECLCPMGGGQGDEGFKNGHGDGLVSVVGSFLGDGG